VFALLRMKTSFTRCRMVRMADPTEFAMSIKVVSTDLHIVNTRLRMPFRFGITTVTVVPHLFLRAIVELDGRRQSGMAADFLPNKWFTKDPDTTFEQDIADMLKIIGMAGEVACAGGKHATVFDFWEQMYQAHAAWAGGWNYPPLLASFGPSLVERAVIDAYLRDQRITFAAALRENRLGIHLGKIHQELGGAQPCDLLPGKPLRSIIVRHTVGLTDPLTDADIADADRVNDGLPQSLEACIHVYGLTHFKIKLWGDVQRDQERVRKAAEVISRLCGNNYAYTMDGNENFKAVVPFRQFWEGLTHDPALTNFLGHLIFVEQPLHRSVALGDEVAREFSAWKDRPPTIIDESDATLSSARHALSLGYVGTSHKNCKGVIKGIANACLLAHRRKTDPARQYIQSAEDLTNIGPIALTQDLSALANFGIPHAERNGQHYFKGLSMFPRDVQESVLRSHPDLYRRHADGYVASRIEGGMMQIDSVVDHAFGNAIELDPSQFTPADKWTFQSLIDN
jgi:hypothetical protein